MADVVRVADADVALGDKVLNTALHVSRDYGVLLLVGALALSWAIPTLCGGASIVPPHLFYLPILFAGLRFGALAALGTSVASGLLAGPLMYSDVSSRTSQSLLDWGTRAVFFVVIGQLMTAMCAMAVADRRCKLDDLDTAQRLVAAMDQARFVVHFQPIVSLGERSSMTGAEALVRLRGLDGELVGPDEFIPSAERTGMIRPLGEFVLRSACEQMVAWRRQGLVDASFTLSVNVSPRQLDAADFTDRVAGVLRETAMDPGQLQLEITETALAEHPEQFTATLHALRRLGVRLALDDFGTGHSTLAEVQRLPVSTIKVDRVFVAALGDGRSAIAENVVSLARSLELSSVAEGVETAEQARLLTEMGCERGQGYLYGRPVPGDEFALSLVAAGSSEQVEPTDEHARNGHR